MPQKRKYKWYPNVQRYRDKRGRFMAERTVGQYIDQTTVRFAADVRKRTDALIADFSEEKFLKWSTDLRRDLLNMHNAVTVIALGGKKAALQFGTQNASAWAEAESATAFQLQRFDRFMLGIVSGAIPINNAMAVRAAMYPLAAFGTYQNAVRIRQQVMLVYDEEMRVLQSGNPCDDCIVEAARGWQAIGTLRRIGDSVCISRCRCYFKFRKSPAK